jgi:hypothetical protein
MDIRLQLLLSEQDKTLLDALAQLNGDASMSAVVRRLIRDEASRRGIVKTVATNGHMANATVAGAPA